jgi:hypothetical protein
MGKGERGKGKGKGTGVPRIFLWRKNLYNFGMILDAEWQDVAKGAGTSVLCPSCRSRRESVGVLLDWATPRDRVCACTDSGSLTTWKTHMMSLPRKPCLAASPVDSCSHPFWKRSALLSSRVAAIVRRLREASPPPPPPPLLKVLWSISVVLRVFTSSERATCGSALTLKASGCTERSDGRAGAYLIFGR